MPIKYLTPTLDKWVDEANPADTNNSTTVLRIMEDNASAKTTVALLTWDIAGEIPAGATIVDAYFSFWWEEFVGTATVRFKIMKVTSAWDGLTDWTTIPTRSGLIASWNKADLGIDDDVPTVIGYDYIRDIALKDIYTGDEPDALVNLVQGWYDTSITNHGVSIEWSKNTPGVDTYYDLYSSDDSDSFRHPYLVIEYIDGDTLPATYNDERGSFYGSALDLLERELIPQPDLHLYVEYPDDTEVDLVEDLIGASGLGRNIPFLFEQLEMQFGSFLLKNPDGRYSETNLDSDFYAGALNGAFIRAVVEIDGQQKVLYRGEILETRDSSSDQAEILCAPYFLRYLDYELTTPRDRNAYNGADYLGSPPSHINGTGAEIIYEAFHNYAGLPDADINLDRFADADASHATYIGQIWYKNRLADRVRDICDVSRTSVYVDGNGDLALHGWRPSDPTIDDDDEVNSDSFEWFERRDHIVNQLDIDWRWEFPPEIDMEPRGEETTYNNPTSIGDTTIGAKTQSIKSTALRGPASVAGMGYDYTRMLAYPIKHGTLRGGAEFLRYDLGSVFWLRNDTKGIYSKVMVVDYDPNPGFDGAWSITMQVIPTNWTLPYLTYEGMGGTPLVSFTNEIASPVPDSIAYNLEYNGELTITIGWTYEHDLIRADGIHIYWNHGTTAGQATPTNTAFDGQVMVEPAGDRTFSFRVPSNHYVTIGIAAYARTNKGLFYSPIVGSAAAPDWDDANYIASIIGASTPSNVPTNLTAAATAETDVGTASALLTWQYVQGAIEAEMFVIIGNFGDAAPAAPVYGSEDWSMVLPANTRDHRVTFEKKNKFGTFEIAAVRRSDQGWAFTAWQSHANWTDIQPSAAAYDLDDITDGGTYEKVKGTALTAGEVDLGNAGVIGKTADNIESLAAAGTTVEDIITEMMIFSDNFITSAGNSDATTPPERTFSKNDAGIELYYMLKAIFKKSAGMNTLRMTAYVKEATTWTTGRDSDILLRIMNYDGTVQQSLLNTDITGVAAYTKTNFDEDISGLTDDQLYQVWIGYEIDNKAAGAGQTDIYIWAPVLTQRPD